MNLRAALTYPLRLLRHWAERPEGRPARITYCAASAAESRRAA